MKSILLYQRHRRVVMAISVMVALLSTSSCAQNPVALQQEIGRTLEAPQRYPAGSIQSIQSADSALATVERERALVEEQHARSQQACYNKFFMTACTDEARERHRIALEQLRGVEVEANAFKRRAKADERDKALAAKRAEEEANAPKSSQEQKNRRPPAGNETQLQPSAGATSDRTRAAGVAVPSSREARHQDRIERAKANEEAEAKKRAENTAAYEKKVQEAEARQREVAERKAKKERERAEKNAATPTP